MWYVFVAYFTGRVAEESFWIAHYYLLVLWMYAWRYSAANKYNFYFIFSALRSSFNQAQIESTDHWSYRIWNRNIIIPSSPYWSFEYFGLFVLESKIQFGLENPSGEYEKSEIIFGMKILVRRLCTRVSYKPTHKPSTDTCSNREIDRCMSSKRIAFDLINYEPFLERVK